MALAGLATAAVAIVPAVLAADARADHAQVTVVSPGGSSRTLALAALAGREDVIDRAYVLRAAAGPGEQRVTGFSLGALVEAADADPFAFSYVEVQRPAGGSVLLSREQALDPDYFADGPPAIYATAGGTGFVRPGANDEDLNAEDSFEAPQGVTLVLRKGKPLLVEIEASTRRARPGEPVSFEAVVRRAGAGESLAYSWYFDDGGSASGETASHSFAERGSYDVVLGVTTPGDRAGASAVVTIQVGAPLSGPDRKGGGRRRDATAPDHGAVAGTRGAVPPGPGAGDASGGGVGSPPPDTRPAAALSVRQGRTDTAREREVAAGARVAGELVRAAKPLDETKAVAARSGRLERGAESAGLPGAAVGVLIVAGLLGAGALVETRSLLR